MSTKTIIVDSEVRVVHPAARCPSFAKHTQEPARKDVYASKDIKDAVKLWGVESLIESMDENQIDYAIVSGLAWNSSSILRDNNVYVEECLQRYPTRLRGLYTPDVSDPESAAAEILALDAKYYIGVEIIPKWQNTTINAQELEPIFEAVKQRDFFLKVYTAHPTQTLDGDSPYRTLEFLRTHPEIKTLIPHLGGLLCLYKLFPPIAAHLKNAYFITSVSATMEMVEFAASVCSDNLLFGTDFPFNHSFDQKTPLDAMKALNVAREDQAKILGDNATRLFGLNRTFD